MGAWSRFESLIFGAAVGRAGGDAITPVLEPVRQKAWRKNRLRVLDVGSLADLRAKGMVKPADAADEAGATGYSAARLEALAALKQSYPGLAELDAMSNRKAIDPALIDKALARHGIPDEYQAAIKTLFSEILTPGELAAAIHRGLVPDPGLLKGEQPEGPRTVESYPVYPIKTLEEAEGSGYDRDRLGVLVGLQGLPMGPHEAAQALFRGIITHGDYIAAFNESNSRNEWAQAVLDQSRQIPTARDFFENALRGYHTFDWALEQAKRHGMSEEDATTIYQNQGRPMNVRQITQALARGGVFKPEPGELTDPYMASIVEGNVKPAYYNLALSLRYTYPSAFALRGLVQSKAITVTECRDVLLYEGWEPGFADKVSKAWAAGGSSAEKDATASDLLTDYEGYMLTEAQVRGRLKALGYADDELQAKIDLADARRVRKYRDAVVAKAHTQYVKGRVTRTEAANALRDVKVTAKAIGEILPLWDIDRDLEAVRLTAAEVRAEYRRATLTLDEAVSQLIDRGYTDADARAYLGITSPRLTASQIIAAVRVHSITEAEGLTQLAGLGYSTADAHELLASQIAELTSKQITSAVDAGTITREEGLQRLILLGYSAADAAILLPPPSPLTP